MSALISSLAVNVFDHSQRHRAVLSRRESVRPRQIRFFLSEETPPALSGLAHSLSRTPDTRDETFRHLAAFSQATVFLPRILCLTRRIFLSAARHLRRSPTRPRRVYDSNFYINKRKRAFDRSGRLASRLLEPPLSSELSVRSFRTGHLNAETIRRPEKVYFPPFKTFFRQSIFCRHSLLLALYFFRIFPKVSAASSLLRCPWEQGRAESRRNAPGKAGADRL